ncbi:hypothetical protein niasHT_036859 [Heterodera trifolii]|uniref:SET domain-containing protein n=1 Tax=Heterodera trifolii TaxID=157864 RepID=A0ABD2HZX7_9BILA
MFRADAIANFERWLHQQSAADDGGQRQFLWSKIELRPVEDDDGEAMGYGIFAREDIRLNETAIKVPERMMITAGRVADIGEYAEMMERVPLDPCEVLALFFCFERVHFDYFCDQSTPRGPFSVQWPLDIPPGFARFMKMRGKRRKKSADDGEICWRPYLGILPLRFGTPLFRHYLRDPSGDVRLRRLAAKLPHEAKNKLLDQLAELRKLERKLFTLLYASKFDQKTNYMSKTFERDDEMQFVDKVPKESVEFWREMCCWAWHVVNTRCIFVPNLPFHPLVDRSHFAEGDGAQHPRGETTGGKKCRRRMGRTKDDAGGGTQTAGTVNGYGSDREGDQDEDYGGSLAIIPLVDMLNHSTDAQCVAMFDHKHSRHYLVRADQHFVPAGRQLFVCYGAHDNARLWVEYGFTIKNESNPFNRVPLPRGHGKRVSEKRREVLRKANLSCTIYATDEKPSFSLRKSCAILLLERDKLQNWSQYIFGDNNCEDDDDENDGQQSSDGSETQLLASILGHLQNALEGRMANCGDPGGENGANGHIGEEEEKGHEEEAEMVASLWEEQVEIVRGMARHLTRILNGGSKSEGTDQSKSD